MWKTFETRVRRAEQDGLRGLGHAELRELALLYRQTASDLATVREDPSSNALGAYLNQLMVRAHNLLYGGLRERPRSLAHFLAHDWPRIVRASFPEIALAFGIFAVFAAASFLAALGDDGLVRAFLSPEMRQTIDRGHMWTHSILGIQPQASSWIMTHNISVSFLTFASGIPGGLFTFYLVAFNGLNLGIIAAACARGHMNLPFWSFVAGHGFIELSTLFVSGAAGFQIARGLLFPGFLPRRMSLERAAAGAVRLVAGVVPVLVVAGTVEGFVSPSGAPAALKLALGLSLFALLAAWVLLGGRGDEVGE